MATLVVMAVVTSGCKIPFVSKSEEAPPTVPSTPVVTDPNAQGVGNTVPGAGSASSTQREHIVAAPNEQIQTSDLTPKAFVRAIGKKPIAVVVYQPGALLDAQLLAEVKAAVAATKGGVATFYIHASEYQLWGDMPETVGIYGAPSVAIVGRSGKLRTIWTGYVDRGLIGSALRLAAAEKGAAVSPSDAPADTGPSSLDTAAAASGSVAPASSQ